MAELSQQAIRKLSKELKDLVDKPVEGLRVCINEHDLSDVQAELDGPASTPFEGGVFRLRLSMPVDYPATPPKGFFLTRIFHPNVAPTSGEICVNVLKKDWTAETGLRHVLMIIRCLLIEPYPDSALNAEAGRLLQEDYAEYAKHARLMTSIHAQPTRRATPLATSCSNQTSGGQGPATGNHGSAGSGGAGATGADGVSKKSEGEGASSPALKKPKQGEGKPGQAAMSKVKKSLKRL